MMKNIFLGALAGIVLGSAVAWGYGNYLAGIKIADLQAQLDAANEKLAKSAQEKKIVTPEITAATEQIDQLVAANDDLKKQLEVAKSAAAATAPPPALNPMMLMGMMRGMRGGMNGQQRLFLLQTRLHLTADQTAKLKAAMAADDKARRAAFEKRRNNGGGPPNPQDFANANSFDQTLDTILSPEQKSAYQKVQADEQSSRAETMAAIQMNSMAPLLQLTDSQKDQMSSELYQVQVLTPDPMALMANPNASAILAEQAKATQAVLAKVLTQDQQALYQQSVQSMGDFGGRQRGNGGNNAPAPNPAPAASAVASSAPSSTSAPTADGVHTPTTATATNAASATPAP